ncbi:medium-chain fatty acid-CoA ligase faa2 [Coemansia sp. RSA 552]|nr:medium-chain fatty acid-CoA ligase faa2 [Coemansia sp. RSA 552]
MKSFKVPSSEVPGYSAIYRNSEFKDGTQGTSVDHIKTTYGVFQHMVEEYPDRDFLGTRKLESWPAYGDYEWTSGKDAAKIVDEFGAGLDQLYATHALQGPADIPTQQQPLGIYSINRAEWVLADFAAQRSRRYIVGICDTVGTATAEFIINHSQVEVVVCSMDKIPRMLDRIDQTPKLKVIISMDKLDVSEKNAFTLAFNADTAKAMKERAESLGLVMLDMDEVRQLGRDKPTEASPPSPNDLCTVCYTSGTTGAQKGVMMTHDSVMHSIRGYVLTLKARDSTYLSYLPLVHAIDRTAIYTFMVGHVRIGFYSGDLTNFLDDAQALKPTVMFAPPRLLNRVYDRIVAATTGAKGLKGLVSRIALKSKTKRLVSGQGLKHKVWDRLVFSKVAAQFGGRLNLLVTGAMTISPEVITFFRAALSCNVVEVYSQTESCIAAVSQALGDTSTGNSGTPSPGIDIRLRSVEGMCYKVTDDPCPRGEIMIRGRNIFSGYFKSAEPVNTMDGEWHATGDVGRVNTDGTITILDRTKNIFKTGQGIWVAPERIESAYATHPLVQSVFIHGDDLQRDVVAVVVPDESTFVPWASRIIKAGKNQTPPTLPNLCSNEDVIKALLNELMDHALATGITVPELVKAIHCDPVPFEKAGGGLRTSTAKLKRSAALAHYKNEIDGMFAGLDNSAAPTVLEAH